MEHEKVQETKESSSTSCKVHGEIAGKQSYLFAHWRAGITGVLI